MANKRRISSGNTVFDRVFKCLAVAAFYLAGVLCSSAPVAAENSQPAPSKPDHVKVGVVTTSQPAAKAGKTVVESTHAAEPAAKSASSASIPAGSQTRVVTPARTVDKTHSLEKPVKAASLMGAPGAAPEKPVAVQTMNSKSAADKPVSKKGVPDKSVTAKGAVESDKAKPNDKEKSKDKDKEVTAKAAAHNRSHANSLLVPPPPPDTPTMIPTYGGQEANGLMPMEYMSPDLLKKRKQDLVAQLEDAKTEAKKKTDDAESIRLKGKQFKTLFEEGVISKRELETAEKEANDVDSSINRAQLRVSELQTLLDGVSARINQINKKSTKTVQIKKYTYTKSRHAH